VKDEGVGKAGRKAVEGREYSNLMEGEAAKGDN